MKFAFALVLGLLCFATTTKAGLFDDEELELTLTEGISYDIKVFTDNDKLFTGTFEISKEDAKAATTDSAQASFILFVRMTGMSYKRNIHIGTTIINETGTFNGTSYVVEGDSITSLPTGGDLNTAHFDLRGACNNGCTVKFTMHAECEYTCFRSISTRISAHVGSGRELYRGPRTQDHYTPLTLHEWSSEVRMTSDSVDYPNCFVIDIEDKDTTEYLITTERSNDGSPLLVLAGSGKTKAPSQRTGSDWVMVNAQNYRDLKPGKNYLCLSTTDVSSSEETFGRIKVGAASTLSVSLFLLFAIITLMF